MRRFFLIFVGVQLLLFGVELLNTVQTHVVLPWTALLAHLCAVTMKLWDGQVLATGKVLMNPATGFGVSVEPGCNGVEACIVLIAAMLAFPASWRHKLVGLGLGFVAVQLLNMVRVISLYYLGQWNMDWFRFAHEYLWQGLIMLDVLVVFLVWINRLPKAPLPPTAPAQAA